jgi:choline dehydrogenase-like flavoprotein
MAFAAGAKEVMAPIFGAATFKSERELDAMVESPPRGNRLECMAFHPLGSAKMSNDPRRGVVKPTGETWAVDNLIVADGSVLPTSIGVNSQLPVMGVAMMIARGICQDWGKYARPHQHRRELAAAGDGRGDDDRARHLPGLGKVRAPRGVSTGSEDL